MVKTKILTTPNNGEDVVQQEFSFTVFGTQNGTQPL